MSVHSLIQSTLSHLQPQVWLEICSMFLCDEKSCVASAAEQCLPYPALFRARTPTQPDSRFSFPAGSGSPCLFLLLDYCRPRRRSAPRVTRFPLESEHCPSIAFSLPMTHAPSRSYIYKPHRFLFSPHNHPSLSLHPATTTNIPFNNTCT